MRRSAPALAALALLAGCGDDEAAPQRAAAATGPVVVELAGSQFAPAVLTVPAGREITFRNADAIAHTVTATSGAGFDSGTIEGGGSFAVTPRSRGTIAFLCNFHPGMTGTITVS